MAATTRATSGLTADLRRLGVVADDLVMVHASLRKIGSVEGGADGVIDAIQAAIGPEGTMLMVLGAHDDWAWVNRRAEDERPELLVDAEPFDPLVTPADPDVGALAEVFRQRQETGVSNHPEGRFAASGPLAGRLLEDVPWDDYFGRASPLERFVQLEGRVLRMGADLDTVTLLHYAEYLAPIADKRRVRRHRMVAADTGSELRIVAALDDNDGIVDWEGEDYFTVIIRKYLTTGRAGTGVVGNATCELIDAADLVEFAVRWMGDHL